MTNNPPRGSRLILRRALLVAAILTSAAAAVVIVFAITLIVTANTASNDPESMNGLAFPIALVVLGVGGLPLTLASAASWAGYHAATRRSRQLPR